jgi:hypothetical protein
LDVWERVEIDAETLDFRLVFQQLFAMGVVLALELGQIDESVQEV